ncbi:MAG: VaFE repeat-containing surface-anchored protein, partial [Firmicutes bacterium]|nr:VaFE repeat-containing surface-anchored protein [Bacillota bacterium]
CGTLMEQESGKPLLENGRKITAEQIFRPQSEEGSVEMTFCFDGSKLGGRNVVVFEKLYLLVDTDGDGTCDARKQVAGHEDIHDAGQTVKLEKPDTPDQPQKPARPETPAKVPKTGDTTGGMIYLALMAFSMVLFTVIMACERSRRRKGEKNEVES